MHMGRVPSQKCQESPFNFTLCWTQVFHLQECTRAGKVEILERAGPQGQCSVLHALQEYIQGSKQNGPVLVMQLLRGSWGSGSVQRSWLHGDGSLHS